jgi:hypothetical protein
MSSNGGVISERGIWKELEVVIAQFYGTTQHMPGGTEENHENFGQNSRSLCWYLNPGPSEYEAAA